MVRLYILHQNHNHTVSPCNDVLAWGMWMEKNFQSTIVKKTQIRETEVSTVFLGIDHNFTLKGPPLLFETMVFGPLDPDYNIQERYSTWNEALAGHEEIVRRLTDENRYSAL